MEPELRWCIRGSPRRLGQVGLRHPVQDLILADSSDIGHASRLQPLQQPRLREPRIHPHDHRAAHTPPTAVHHPERQLQRLFPQVAGSRKNLPVDQVPRLGTTRHQPVVHPLAIVSVPFASRGMPMDLHRETVHVQVHRLFPSLLPWGLSPPFSPPAFDHLDPTARQLRHRLVQDRKVLLPAERVQQSGQGRL